MNGQEKIIKLFHASTDMVILPVWDHRKPGKEKETRDFGEGFYCCKDKDYPIYLYCGNDIVRVNEYNFNISGLNVLYLNNDAKWLFTVAFHRSSFSKKKKYHPLRDKVRQYISSFDLVVGTISDDNYYSTMDLFIRNVITDFMAIEIAQMMNFGIQYVSKSSEADKCFSFLGSNEVEHLEVLKYRKKKEQDREIMEEQVEEKRVKIHSRDNGKLFAQLVEEVGNDVETWYRQ